MKTVFTTAPLVLIWLSLQAVAGAEGWPEFNRHGRRLNQACTWENILQQCGNTIIPTASPDTYPTQSFRLYQRELIDPLVKYDKCLRLNPNCEGRDNPDKAMAWAVVHFICTHWEFQNNAQVAMYECMEDVVGCDLNGDVPEHCEGFNDGGPTSDRVSNVVKEGTDGYNEFLDRKYSSDDSLDSDDENPDIPTTDKTLNQLNQEAWSEGVGNSEDHSGGN